MKMPYYHYMHFVQYVPVAVPPVIVLQKAVTSLSRLPVSIRAHTLALAESDMLSTVRNSKLGNPIFTTARYQIHGTLYNVIISKGDP
jgi:hypothetical protein